RAVNAAEKLEQFWLEGLHADADAIDSGIAIAEKFVAVDSSRVSLQCYFAIKIDWKRCRDPGEELADAFRLERRRGAAAEEDTLHGPSAPRVRVAVMLQLPQQRVGILHFRNVRHDMGIEIAVRALTDAI